MRSQRPVTYEEFEAWSDEQFRAGRKMFVKDVWDAFPETSTTTLYAWMTRYGRDHDQGEV
jgi:hypothetical protein